jgi:hypothetical protein
MKKWILRCFGLADDQLRGKKAKFNGWFCIFLGCTFIIGALFVYLYVEPIVDNIEYKYARCIKHIKLDTELPQQNVNILRALRMLDYAPDIPKNSLFILVLFVLCFGFLYTQMGLMYLKFHSVLNKEPSSKKENEIANQTQPHHPMTENKFMNHEDTKTSIDASLRKLILILAVPSIVFSVFLIFIMGFIIYRSRSAGQSYENSRTVEIVVAKTNIVAGAVLGYDNLGVKRFTQSSLQTKDYIIEDHAYVVIGYRIKKPLEFNEPLTWHNTDIVITNKVSR